MLVLLVGYFCCEYFAFYDGCYDIFSNIFWCANLDKVSKYFVIYFFPVSFILCSTLFFVLDSFFFCYSGLLFCFSLAPDSFGLLLCFSAFCFNCRLLFSFSSFCCLFCFALCSLLGFNAFTLCTFRCGLSFCFSPCCCFNFGFCLCFGFSSGFLFSFFFLSVLHALAFPAPL